MLCPKCKKPMRKAPARRQAGHAVEENYWCEHCGHQEVKGHDTKPKRFPGEQTR